MQHLLRVVAVLFVLVPIPLVAQVELGPNAPKDKTVQTSGESTRRLQQAMAPYIAQARATYPQAKQRFLAGLPPKHTFFVTTQIRDSRGNSEIVFVAVRSIREGVITGVLWNDIAAVKGYRGGDVYAFPEKEMVDWLISNPDGTEEGNVVGKFIDHYQP